MNNIILRPAEINDLDILYSFEQGIISFERPFDETLKDDPINYYDLKEMILSVETEVVVAIANNEIIGSAYAQIRAAKPYLTYDKFAYLGFMFVTPDHRGKGINKKIIDYLKSWCRKQGVFEIRLDVYHDNPSALRAYEKAGFSKLLVNMRMDINR